MTDNERIEEKLDSILEKMEKIESLVVKVVEEVKPTIDELMNSKLISMLGIGKKK